jgi:aspartate dehydrogenase
MRVALIGGGTIARLFVDHIRRGDLGEARVAAIMGRDDASRGKPLAVDNDIAYVTTLDALMAQAPDVVVEAASHDAVREFGETLLARGIALIVLSGGALCDDVLRAKLESAAMKSGALLYVPPAAFAVWMR